MPSPHAASATPSPLEWTVARAKLSDDAKPLAAGARDLDAILKALVDGGHAGDGARLIAAALPARQGIWWGWTAATHATKLAAGDANKPEAREALGRIEQWIATPDDAHRRAAWAIADKAGMDTPAGMLCVAIFLSGGSIAPPELPPLPALPGVHAEILAGSVLLSALADAEHFQALATAFVAQGHAIVQQLGGWDTAIALTRDEHDRLAAQHERAVASAGKR